VPAPCSAVPSLAVAPDIALGASLVDDGLPGVPYTYAAAEETSLHSRGACSSVGITAPDLYARSLINEARTAVFETPFHPTLRSSNGVRRRRPGAALIAPAVRDRTRAGQRNRR